LNILNGREAMPTGGPDRAHDHFRWTFELGKDRLFEEVGVEQHAQD